MSQNIELKNFELATVNPSNKTWTSADLFCYWANSIQTIAGFALISSLYLIYNLSSYLVLSLNSCINSCVFFYIFNWSPIPKTRITFSSIDENVHGSKWC